MKQNCHLPPQFREIKKVPGGIAQALSIVFFKKGFFSFPNKLVPILE
jgi:hypothetical protein